MSSLSLSALCHWIHRHFFKLLLASYGIAVLAPGLGQLMRSYHLGSVNVTPTNGVDVTLPMAMLALLLFNAGLGIKLTELRHVIAKPLILFGGLLANLLLPVLFIILLQVFLDQWHNPHELQQLLVGIALITAMPIAGSSTAWAQNANGNLALSLGFVVLSTLLSPITTPFILHIFGWLTLGDYSEDLHELASNGVNLFLLLTVVIPSFLGMTLHFVIGETRLKWVKPHLKLINHINLLLLSYSNAAVALPQAFHKPDWDFLVLIAAITTTLCGAAFAAGWVISRVLKTDTADKAALMFGLGMNNNGTGLVLSSLALADHPLVMLPIIFYNLAQQVVAALVDTFVFKEAESAAD